MQRARARKANRTRLVGPLSGLCLAAALASSPALMPVAPPALASEKTETESAEAPAAGTSIAPAAAPSAARSTERVPAAAESGSSATQGAAPDPGAAVPGAAPAAGATALAGRVPSGSGEGTNDKCPVQTDEDIDPTISVQYEGKRVYLCCSKCRRKFRENPQAYLVNLPQFVKESETTTGPTGAGAPESSGARAPGAAAKKGPEAAPLATPMRLVRWLGRFHPVVIHFPIALILAAAGAEVLGWFTKRQPLHDAARLALVAGALSAVVAGLLGWAAWYFSTFPRDLALVLFAHRGLGTLTTLVSLAAAFLAVTGGGWETPRRRLLFRVLLFASAALVGLTGHLGGTLIYGADHYAW